MESLFESWWELSLFLHTYSSVSRIHFVLFMIMYSKYLDYNNLT